MKVGLLGITGGVGGIFAKLALDKGHEIIALARTPSKVTLKHAKLKIIQGNSTSAADVAKVAQGVDVVVSCVGQPPRAATHIMETTAANILSRLRRRSFLFQASACAAARHSSDMFSRSSLAAQTFATPRRLTGLAAIRAVRGWLCARLVSATEPARASTSRPRRRAHPSSRLRARTSRSFCSTRSPSQSGSDRRCSSTRRSR